MNVEFSFRTTKSTILSMFDGKSIVADVHGFTQTEIFSVTYQTENKCFSWQ